MRNITNNKKGFTLIELIVVIAVLAILTALATPRLSAHLKDARVASLKWDTKTLSSIAEIYHTEHDQGWPTTAETVVVNGKTLNKLDEVALKDQYQSLKNPISEYALDETTGEVYHIDGAVDGKGDTWFNETIVVRTPVSDGGSGSVEESENVSDPEYFGFDPSTGTITYFYPDGRRRNLPTLFDPVIPAEIGGVPVVSIEPYAFINNNLTSVVIPDSVTSIDAAAFDSNQLASVTIGKGVKTIGSNAFSNNNLTSVVIPDSVTTIGSNAFSNNNLTSVVISDSVTSIDFAAFSYNQLTSITLGGGVTTIGHSAFGHNRLTSVVIPDSVTSIYSGAFYFNGPDGNDAYGSDISTPGTYVIEYGMWVRKEAAGTEEEEEEEEDSYYNFDPSTGTILHYYTRGKSYRSPEILNPVIPSEIDGVPVRHIGYQAFINSGLVSVTIPDTVLTIGDQAFEGNTIANLVIPDSVTSIGQSAFRNSGLNNLSIGESVVTIGWYAFADNSISDVVIPDNVEIIDSFAFSGSGVSNLVIGNGVRRIEMEAFRYNNLETVTFGSGPIYIGPRVFANNKFTSVVIPESVSGIGMEAFSYNPIVRIELQGDPSKDQFVFRYTGPNMDSGMFNIDGPNIFVWSTQYNEFVNE